MSRKVLIYAESQISYEKARRALQSHLEEEIIHIDEEHNRKTKLLPQIKQTVVVLVDLDGGIDAAISFIETIRQMNDQKDLPILGISSNSEISLLKKFMDAGCTDFILKPYEDVNLLNRVLKAMNNQIIVDPSGYLKGENVNDLGEEVVPMPQTVPLEWHSDFEIGVESIDEDHKKIVEHYKMLYLSMREGKGHGDYQAHINFLMEYVSEHFEREEALQQSSTFPGFEKHQKLHQAFTLHVSKLLQANREHEVTHQELIKLNLFIKEWLLRHILVEDRKIGEHIKSMEAESLS